MLIRLPRAVEKRDRGLVVLLVEVRDTEHQLRVAGVLELTLVDAALDGRDYVIPDDVKALALPALRHRVILSPAAEIDGRRPDQIIQGLVDLAAAPR